MIRARSSVDATRLSRDQERSPLGDIHPGEPPRATSAIHTDRVPGIRETERKKSPPAPLCDGTTSLRLDERGQQVERVRNALQTAGTCLLLLSPAVAWIVTVINGDGERSEDPTGLLIGAGVAIVGVLLVLGGWLTGRRTSDWWHPRMREMAPGGYSREDPSLEPARRKSASAIDSEREAERRYRMAKRVRGQIRAAHIFDRRLDGGGTLLTEPILVLHGRRRGDLAIFDQEGNQLGTAIRVRDPTSESPEGAWISQVRDSQGRSVFAVVWRRGGGGPRACRARAGPMQSAHPMAGSSRA
jgi:hypothetical protein